jgi:elongation factor Ts
MAKITAAEVNKLRKTTGAGMMDCKKALVETDGDFEKAIDYLRKKGQKVAAKRADREAGEGFVFANINEDKTFGTIIMLNCETDFVAKNQDFIDFAKKVSAVSLENKTKNLDELKGNEIEGRTIADHVTDLTGTIGEKIDLGAMECLESELVAGYNHHGNRIATLVALNQNGEQEAEAGHDLAMQVAAMNPVAVDKDSVSDEVKERELKVGREQAIQEGKPEQIVEKIAQGKLQRFFKDNTLAEQDFIKDTKKSVSQYLKEVNKDLKVVNFKRVGLDG